MDNLIEVICLVLPTGEALWFEALDENGKYRKGYVDKVLNKWKADHPEFHETGCTIAAASITMPHEKYIAIGAHLGGGAFQFPSE